MNEPVRRASCALLISACLCPSILADGAAYVVQEMAKVRIPGQSALITFDGKTERLVVETTIEAEGKDFAWVVPVPSMPKIEAATPGLFPTLRMITRPRVIGYMSDWVGVSLWIFFFGGLLWAGTFRWLSLTQVLVIAVIAAVFSSMFLTAGGGGAPPAYGVNVHGKSLVGSYETVTISGTGGAGILEWLNKNGYRVPEGARPALARYASEGWFFVAARLRRDTSEAGRFSPHPLSFTFATARAVYPLRLTGIENGPVSIDLYVVGKQEAFAAPFIRQRAARLDFLRSADRSRPRYGDDDRQDEFVPVFHELLRSYCKGFTSLTLLSATLRPEQMKEDCYLQWKAMTPFRHVYFSLNGAFALASQFAAWTFLVASVVGLIFLRGHTTPGQPSRVTNSGIISNPKKYLVLILLAGPFLVGAGVCFCLPLLRDERVVEIHWSPFYQVQGGVHQLILDDLGKAPVSDAPQLQLTAYEKEAASIAAVLAQRDPDCSNPFTGRPIRKEDSPGNYEIELVQSKPTYFYFDANGQKISLGVIGEKNGARNR